MKETSFFTTVKFSCLKIEARLLTFYHETVQGMSSIVDRLALRNPKHTNYVLTQHACDILDASIALPLRQLLVLLL